MARAGPGHELGGGPAQELSGAFRGSKSLEGERHRILGNSQLCPVSGSGKVGAGDMGFW